MASLPKKTIEWIERNQIEKTKDEVFLIDQLNKLADDLIRDSVPKFKDIDIPYINTENIHILKDIDFKTIIKSECNALVNIENRGILIKGSFARKSPLVFSSDILHEILHLKGFTSIEVNKEGESFPRRSGVSSLSSIKKEKEGDFHAHFLGLNEAIVSSVQKTLLSKIIDMSMFEKEKERMKGFSAVKNKVELAKKNGLDVRDIYWVTESGREGGVLPYPKHRELLDYMMGEIMVQYPEKYKNKNEVFKEFLKAHFSGELINLGKIIEGTFGKGSFRVLGEMTDENESAERTLERLKRMKETEVGHA